MQAGQQSPRPAGRQAADNTCSLADLSTGPLWPSLVLSVPGHRKQLMNKRTCGWPAAVGLTEIKPTAAGQPQVHLSANTQSDDHHLIPLTTVYTVQYEDDETSAVSHDGVTFLICSAR